MNNRLRLGALLALILAAGVVYGVMRLRDHFDRPPLPRASAARAAVDYASLRVLWRDGMSAPGLTPEDDVVAALLPSADDEWVRDFPRLLETDVAAPPKLVPIEWIEPAGRRMAGPFRVLVSGDMPGGAVIDVADAAAPGGLLFSFDAGIRVPTPAGEGQELQAGTTYVLKARRKDNQDAEPAEIRVEVLSAAETAFLRRRLDDIRQRVPDLTLRRFAQALLARKAGLLSEATDILDALAAERPPEPHRGLDEVRADVTHRLGRVTERNRLIKKLRGAQ